MGGTLSAMGLPVELDLAGFADERIPQVLRGLGVLSLHPVLEEKIATGRFVSAPFGQ